MALLCLFPRSKVFFNGIYPLVFFYNNYSWLLGQFRCSFKFLQQNNFISYFHISRISYALLPCTPFLYLPRAWWVCPWRILSCSLHPVVFSRLWSMFDPFVRVELLDTAKKSYLWFIFGVNGIVGVYDDRCTILITKEKRLMRNRRRVCLLLLRFFPQLLIWYSSSSGGYFFYFGYITIN